MPTPRAPGITYPAIRSQIPPAVDDTIRNVYDNLFYLRAQFDLLQTQLADLRNRLAIAESRR